MTKKEVSQRVLRDGKPLGMDRFEWDGKARVFSTAEDDLVIDFSGIAHCTFRTGSYCTFNTGYNCTFDTGFNCTFDTSFGGTFDTGERCVVVRRDVNKVIKLDGSRKIKLNVYGKKGYKVIEEPSESLSGKKVEVKIDDKTYTATID